MRDSISAKSASPALLRGLAATFVTLAVLFGVMAQQQSLAAPVGLGAKTEITDARGSEDLGLVLAHHSHYKGHGYKRHHFKHAHKKRHFKHGRYGHRFKGRSFGRYGHGFKRFRFGGHRGFRSFRHRGGHGRYHRGRH